LKSTPARHTTSNIRPGLTRPKPEHFSTRTALRSLSSASLRPPARVCSGASSPPVSPRSPELLLPDRRAGGPTRRVDASRFPGCGPAEGLRTGLRARAGRGRQTLAPAALAQTMISALTEVVAERLSERRVDLFNRRSCLRTSCRPKEPRGPGRAGPRLPPRLAPRAPAPRSRSPRSSSEESSPPPPPVCRQSH
jgi:hypothetical protein